MTVLPAAVLPAAVLPAAVPQAAGARTVTVVPCPGVDGAVGVCLAWAGLVPPAGFEPAAHGLGNRCSIP